MVEIHPLGASWPQRRGISSDAPAVGCCTLAGCHDPVYSRLFLIPVVCRLSGDGDQEHCVLQDMARYGKQRKRSRMI